MFAKEGWNLIFREMNFSTCLPYRVEDWLMESLSGWNFRGKKGMLESFKHNCNSADSFVNSVQLLASWWISFHKEFSCNYSLSMIIRNWKAFLHYLSIFGGGYLISTPALKFFCVAFLLIKFFLFLKIYIYI